MDTIISAFQVIAAIKKLHLIPRRATSYFTISCRTRMLDPLVDMEY
jgi:hypothetical protein